MDMDYQTMRTFADSWGLVYLVAIFLIAVFWAFRPGGKRDNQNAAQIPFKEDN